jgi:thiamine pyrophosphate-dependent acetolactate synthase large subunit-like protein
MPPPAEACGGIWVDGATLAGVAGIASQVRQGPAHIELPANVLGKPIRHRFPEADHCASFDRALIENSCRADNVVTVALEAGGTRADAERDNSNQMREFARLAECP